MKELQIERIAYQWNNPAGMWVVLKEKRKQRRIPICIGHFEGAAILRGLEKLKLPRPFTHELLGAALEQLGAKVKHIVLTDWKEENQTFYAAIVVESNGATHRIDSRPSDALALAVRNKVPIFAEEKLLELGSKSNEEEAKSKQGKAKSKIVSIPPLVTLWPIESGSPPKPGNQRKKKSAGRA